MSEHKEKIEDLAIISHIIGTRERIMEIYNENGILTRIPFDVLDTIFDKGDVNGGFIVLYHKGEQVATIESKNVIQLIGDVDSANFILR
ncbi:hypothetical protein KKE60_08885 [Patescibacteria group bacterium]|nr:hypothetical protein [Patescibacteria group bacterium]